MATPTTYSVPNNREDLTNIVSRVDPEVTPIYTDARKDKATASLHEWTLDNLSAVDIDGVPEGTDVETYDNKLANLARVGNRVQTFRGTYQVSNELQAVDTAGIADKLALSKTKAMVEMKRSMEASLGSDNEQVAPSSGVAAKSRGLGKFIQNGAQAVNPIPAAYRTPTAQIFSGAIGTFNETVFVGCLESQYTQTGDTTTNVAYVGTKLKTAITNFTKGGASDNLRFNQSASDETLARAVSIYRGDFGTVTIKPDLSLALVTGDKPNSGNANSVYRGYIFPKEQISVAALGAVMNMPNEDKGGGPRGFVQGMISLTFQNPLTAIKIAATAT